MFKKQPSDMLVISSQHLPTDWERQKQRFDIWELLETFVLVKVGFIDHIAVIVKLGDNEMRVSHKPTRSGDKRTKQRDTKFFECWIKQKFGCLRGWFVSDERIRVEQMG